MSIRDKYDNLKKRYYDLIYTQPEDKKKKKWNTGSEYVQKVQDLKAIRNNQTMYQAALGIDATGDYGVLSNRSVIDATSKKLVEHLPSYPQYRFEYKPNSLLDNIFSCEIETNFISQTSVSNFLAIDPIYVTKFSHYYLRNINKQMEIERALYRYTTRYGISDNVGREYYTKDIISNPDDKTKKLIRCLEHHKDKYC